MKIGGLIDLRLPAAMGDGLILRLPAAMGDGLILRFPAILRLPAMGDGLLPVMGGLYRLLLFIDFIDLKRRPVMTNEKKNNAARNKHDLAIALLN